MKRSLPDPVFRYTGAKRRIPLGKKRKRGKAAIGIDIGGTKSLYALLDEDFEVIAEEKLRSLPEKGGLKAFERGMKKSLATLLGEARRRNLDLKVAGVGCAGRIDMRSGTVLKAPNLPFLNGYPLGERVAKITGGRVFVANDVHTGLYGECRLGAARKARNVLGVWVGTGVGGALVVAMPALLRREVGKSIKAHATPKTSRVLKVAVAKLGDHAGTIGAAVLAWDLAKGMRPVDLG